MTSWIGSWMAKDNNNIDNNEEKNEEKNENIIAPTLDEIREKRMAHLIELERKQKEENEQKDKTNNIQENNKNNIKMNNLNNNKNEISINNNNTIQSDKETNEKKNQINNNLKVKDNDKEISNKLKRNLIDEMNKRILKTTLKSNDKHIEYILLKDFNSNNEDNNIINIHNISEVLYGRLMYHKIPENCIMAYLMQTYERCLIESQYIRSLYLSDENTKNEMIQCIKMIQEMVINYSCTALTTPEMFINEETKETNISLSQINILYLLNCIKKGTSPDLPHGFLDLLIINLEDERNNIFVPIFQQLIKELVSKNTNSILSDFMTNILAINLLLKNKLLANVFVNITGFLLVDQSPLTGYKIQNATALGIILKYSTDINHSNNMLINNDDKELLDMFSNITKRTKNDVDNTVKTLRMKIIMLHNVVYEIFRSLLFRSGKDVRTKLLEWIIQVMQVNEERIKENPNLYICSTDGFFNNLIIILLRLCGPFLENDSPKADLIDPTYLLSKENTIFSKELTKLVQINDINQDEIKINNESNEYNFITQCYFLTLKALHLGPVACMRQYTLRLRQLGFLQQRLNDMNSTNNPNAIQLQMQFDLFVAKKMLTDIYLLNPELIQEIIRFNLLSCLFITKICTNNQKINTLPLISPLLNNNKNIIISLPEHIIDDISNSFIFISRFSNHMINNNNYINNDKLLTFIVIFLSSPEYIHSPHVRAKMSQVLFELFLPSNEMEQPDLNINLNYNNINNSTILTNHPLAQEYLSPCLLLLYGDVEQTGFYEKLEHRYNIACILKYLWKLPSHKKAFLKITNHNNNNNTDFIKFANGLMNHINNLVTDALTNLPEIRLLQDEMGRSDWFETTDEQTRKEKESLLEEKEKTVTSSLQLANETIHMMSYLTSEIQEPFLVPELCDRLVSMLNSVLYKLVGPKGIELKVNNPEYYKFRPKIMLQEIVLTILHFNNYDRFKNAVATNGYYDDNVYTNCYNILKRIQLLSNEDIDLFYHLKNDLKNLKNDYLKNEIELGDIPDEFLDPIMCTLMTEPVKLPNSKYIVDKNIIIQHLLNDETDPFNRSPLTPDQLIPDIELKNKINIWLENKRNSNNTKL